MDNRSHQESTWDMDLLGPEMIELKDLDFGLSLTGFDDEELAALFAEKNSGLTGDDDVPEVQENPVSITGDVWLLGRHRLMCGSSIVATDVEKLLNGVKPMLMVTDPPYGVSYDSEWRLEKNLNEAHQTRAAGKVMNDAKADWREAWALFPGEVAYVWHSGVHATAVGVSLEACDFSIRSQIIWAKPALVIGRGYYHWQHEACWYAVRDKGTGHWAGDRKQTTLWQIPNMHRTQGNVDDGKTAHSTQKPVECMRRPILNNSSPGQAVYEPFSGSGTTFIACEKEGRVCLGMELDQRYVDMIVKRWQAFTGKLATLEADGSLFNDLNHRVAKFAAGEVATAPAEASVAEPEPEKAVA